MVWPACSFAQPVIGNVVFLHGITGSDLAVVSRKGDQDGIWVNAPRLILGRVEDLRLADDAKGEADRHLSARPTGVNKRYHLPTLVLQCSNGSSARSGGRTHPDRELVHREAIWNSVRPWRTM